MTIPTVTGKSFDGTPVTIEPNGSPQMLMFVAHWCPHCQREVPIVSEWLKQGGLPASVKLTTVATGTSSSAPNYPPSAWLEKNDWPSPIMADSDAFDAATAFGLESYPYFVWVDADGKVVARASGELTTDQIESVVQQLAAQASG
jgi:thiol-disulfide isomerase/thioredoxin